VPEQHLTPARTFIGDLLELLASGTKYDWNTLEHVAMPQIRPEGVETSYHQEGVSILLEP
jgi:hypothetical protein